jgi:LytR cell envelope-related transcriptional attenuator
MVIAHFVAVVASVWAPGPDADLLGWTSDGRYFAWTETQTEESVPKRYYIEKNGEQIDVEDPDKLPPADRAKVKVIEMGMMGAMQTDEVAKLGIVRDSWRDTTETYLLMYSAPSRDGKRDQKLRKRLGQVSSSAAFDAWKKAHALTKAAAKSGPAGSIAITVDLVRSQNTDPNDKPDPPEWHGAVLHWAVGLEVEVAKLSVVATCGATKTTYSAEQHSDAMYVPHWSATPIWAPGGRRAVVAVAEAKSKTMRGPVGGSMQLAVFPCGTRVEVLAPAELDARADPVAAALDKAGYAITRIGPAKARRSKTVVYSDDAHKDIATKLAATIPGGATVDKLDWKPNADIVVALGDSAK